MTEKQKFVARKIPLESIQPQIDEAEDLFKLLLETWETKDYEKFALAIAHGIVKREIERMKQIRWVFGHAGQKP